MHPKFWLMPLLLAPLVPAQVKDTAASTLSIGTQDKQTVVEISNVGYEVSGKLVIKKAVHTKHTVDEIGEQASTAVQAWTLGTDLHQKPIYTLTVSGVEPIIIEGELLQISRGLEDTEWWTLYKLANGQRLFDTYVPLAKFSISRETLTQRYAGLDVPPDDVKVAALKDPHVVAVVTYASAAKVIREALIAADDVKQAQLLRSYADSSRTLEPVERDSVVRSLRLTIQQNFPSPPNPVSVTIPIAGDDLDTAHAQAPQGLHVAAFKR
jgi:hypothetical protein